MGQGPYYERNDHATTTVMTTEAFDLDRMGGQSTLDALIDEVRACGQAALKLYEQGVATRVQIKPDRSPVTEADQRVEERLSAFVHKHFPDAGFVGEETGERSTEKALRFVVDPIDGTRAFVRGLPTWSVLVGVEYEGEPVIGIALQPAVGDMYAAVKGHGARCNDETLHVSKVASLRDALVAHGSLGQFVESERTADLERLAVATHSQRGLHDFEGYRVLLHGRADAMVDPGVKPWDVCAPAVLVREAGGRFTDLQGSTSLQSGYAVATNGLLHNELLTVLS